MNISSTKIWGTYFISKVSDYDWMSNSFPGPKFLLHKYIFFDCIHDIFATTGIYSHYSETNKNPTHFEIEDFPDTADDIIPNIQFHQCGHFL